MIEELKLSVVMPAQDEEGSIAPVLENVAAALEREEIDYEILVIDDDSQDRTAAVVGELAGGNPRIRCRRSHHPRGFGFAVRAGLETFTGDAVVVMMADGSDDPEDLVRYHRILQTLSLIHISEPTRPY